MKKILLVVIMSIGFGCILSVNAQEDSRFTFGVKTGVNLSNSSLSIADPRVGFNIGGTVDYELSKGFFLSSGLEFTTKGAKFSERYFATEISESSNIVIGDKESNFNLMYLQVPLTIGYKIPLAKSLSLNLNAGGYAAYGITSRNKISLTTPVETDGYLYTSHNEYKSTGYDKTGLDRWDFGLLGGIGLQYKKIVLNVNYEFGLRNLQKGPTSYVVTYDQYGSPTGTMNNDKWKTRNLSFSVGYKF
ncbi:porin family protein [Dysgonomonas sp. ZJ709]|uniref:porin family protein n=1 Tax=Dysgonomonas sp. ZJ709 TaxID=2709797 RepID=UPI0013EA2D63|nr:porin family protein [Dysgonomonas sp. ZJ709]